MLIIRCKIVKLLSMLRVRFSLTQNIGSILLCIFEYLCNYVGQQYLYKIDREVSNVKQNHILQLCVNLLYAEDESKMKFLGCLQAIRNAYAHGGRAEFLKTLQCILNYTEELEELCKLLWFNYRHIHDSLLNSKWYKLSSSLDKCRYDVYTCVSKQLKFELEDVERLESEEFEKYKKLCSL